MVPLVRRHVVLAVALAAPFALSVVAPAQATAPTSVDRAPYSAIQELDTVKDLAIGRDGRTYVLHDTSYEVFAAGARAHAEPVREVTFTPDGEQTGSLISVDADGWVTVVTNTTLDAATVYLFGPSATGAATPALKKTNTELDIQQPLDVTDVGDDVAFLDNGPNDIRVYDLRAGALTPSRVIPGGDTTHIFEPYALESDRAGRLAVTGQDWAAVFGVGATGEVAPQRYLAGSRTTLSDAGAFTANVFLDDRGDLLVASVHGTSGAQTTRILRFAPHTTGNVAPSTTLGGSRTGLDPVSSFDVAPSGTITALNYARPDQLSLFQPIGPYAKPGKVSGLRVTGSAKAAQRTLAWRAASSGSVDTPVTAYVVKVVCGGKARLSRTYSRTTRSAVVRLGSFTRGTCTARVSARNAVGTGATASTAFTVER